MKRKFSFASKALNTLFNTQSSYWSSNTLAAAAATLVFTMTLSQGATVAPAIQTGGIQSVDGGGGAINGNAQNGYFVQGGSLVISNATLTNFKTTGGAGSGGGAALGGAVFVNTGATVTLNNVNFSNNSVKGGQGGVGNVGGSLNSISGGGVGASGSDGYTPNQTTFTDIDGTTGTVGGNAPLNVNGVGGTGGDGGNGGGGGDRSETLILSVTTAALNVVAQGAELAGASQPFTASTIPGIVLTLAANVIDLANQSVALGSFDKSLSDGQIGLGGAGAQGGNGGGGAFAFGGGLGGDGGDGGIGGKNWSGSAYKGGAAGGDAGDGGGGGFGGFGAGGGRGGDGGTGGGGAGVTATPYQPAVPATFTDVNVSAVYKKGYYNPNNSAQFIVTADNLADPDSSTSLLDHDGNSTTAPVVVQTILKQAASIEQIVAVPAKPEILASAAGQRPNGQTGAGGAGGGGGFGAGLGAQGTGSDFKAAGGNGGDGYGGSIFVRAGGSLTITGNATFGGNTVKGGSGEIGDVDTANGTAGVGIGNDIFMMKGSNVVLDAGVGNVITFNAGTGSSIADDSAATLGGATPIAAGSGAGITTKSGLVVFKGTNTYTGETKIDGGVLQAQDGIGVNVDSNINFNGGVLQSNGDFIRYVGTASNQVQWTGSGGFAAEGGDLRVSLNDGLPQSIAALTWNSGNFVPAGSSLLFGSASATGKVTLINDINLAGGNRTILVKANSGNSDHAILTGILSNGSLTVGDSTNTGTLVLKAANTYTGATLINAGTLVLDGSLASTSVTIASGAILSDVAAGLPDATVATVNGTLKLSAAEKILTLNGSGAVELNANRLTVSNGDFSGVVSGSSGLTKISGGSLTLSGASTYTGSTLVDAGTLVLSGSLVSDTINVALGAILTNSTSGLSTLATLTNDGTVNQDSNDSIAALINTGAIKNSGFTLTAANYALNDGSIIDANLGAGIVNTKGTVALNGTAAAATFNVVTGTTTLGSGERLLDTTSLTIDSLAKLKLGGAEKIGVLNGAGMLDNAGSRLTTDSGLFSGVVSGGGGLTKVSTGQLTLSGINTYTDSTLVDAGTLVISGSLVSDTINVALGATLTNSAGGLSSLATLKNNGLVNQNADDTIAALVNIGTVDGSSTLTAATYSLNSGSIINANLGTGIVNGNGTVALNGTSSAATVNILTGTTTLGSAERLLDSTTLTISSGAILKLGGTEKIGVLNGAGSLNNNGSRLTTDSGLFSGVASGGGGLTKVSTGLLTLSGSNTYTGSTLLNAGTTVLSGSLVSDTINVALGATLTNSAGGLSTLATLTNDGLVNQNADDTIAALINTGTINGSSTLTAATYALNSGSVINANLGTGIVNANGTVALNGTSAAATVNVITGTTTLGSAERLLDSTMLTISSGATLILGGAEKIGVLNGAGGLNNNGFRLSADSGLFSGAISGTGGLTKVSPGTLTFSGANTYSGSTLVNAGTVALSGSLVSTEVTVALGATLNDSTGGLAAGTALTANGIVNVTANEQIDRLLGSGSLALTGSIFTVNQGAFSGVISGNGDLVKTTSGLLTLSGANTYSGKTDIKAGTFTLSGSLVSNQVTIDSGATANVSTGGLASDTTLTANGLAAFTANDSIKSLLGAGSVTLTGSTLTVESGAFSGIVSGNGNLTKSTAGILTLSGINTYTGSTSVNAGALTLSGSLASTPVTVASGAVFNVTNSGLSSSAAFTNNGTTNLTLDDTVSTYTSTGILNGPGKLNAGTYNLNGGSMVNTKLGAGNLITNGAVVLSGTSDALSVTVNSGSSLSLNGLQLLNNSASLLVNGSLSLVGGNQTVASLSGAGAINLNTFQFTVTGGVGSSFSGNINAGSTNLVSDGGNLNLSGGTTNTMTTNLTNGGNLNLTGAGTLNTSGITTVGSGSTLSVSNNSNLGSNVILVNGTLIVPNSSSLTYATLTGSGLVNSQGNLFTNRSGFTVRGSLTFSGDFTNSGTFAPGNSPGVTTINGNYTELNTLEAELQTTTPVTGHDQVRVGGTVTLGSASTLIVQTFNGVQPSRGNSYQVIANLAGGSKTVTGTYASVLFDADGAAGPGAALVNAASVFDQATGRVIATGLNAANSTFADLGQTANQRAAATALLGVATAAVGQNQVNTSTSVGNLAVQAISANGGSSSNFARFTPEFFGAFADYSLVNEQQVNSQLRNRVNTLSSLPGLTSPEFSSFGGVSQHQANTGDNADINRTDVYVGGDYSIAKGTSLGVMMTYNTGEISSTYGNSDADGLGVDLYMVQTLNPDFDLYGRVGFGSDNFDITRITTAAIAATGSTDSTVYSGSIGATYKGWSWGEFSIAPNADLNFSNTSVDGFTEDGANDRLTLGSYDTTHLIAQIGASGVWSTKLNGRQFSAELTVGLEQFIVNDQDSQTATLVTAPVSFTQNFADDDSTRAALGLRFGYSVTDQATIYCGYDGRLSSESTGNFNAGVRIGF